MMRSAAVLIAMILSGCGGLFGQPSREEVAWANSPDRRTHAILLETNGGATTSFGYVVELHPADHQGERPVSAGTLYGATRSECAYGVDLHWLNASTLALRFDSAKKVSVLPSVNVGGRSIRLVVQAGRQNDAAPCGGMAKDRPKRTGS
ncbi:hypothetical protein [Sphingomonas sp. Ag1]|jgi:hypothetical protein|uniref:hypothetical protein n=1 Tax=Sphingomonas sp. Ag1 TaxID=1642949 RepID=UPI0012E0556A|nr:hypothetical protein [Sphingomonas sp. Ag1]